MDGMQMAMARIRAVFRACPMALEVSLDFSVVLEVMRICGVLPPPTPRWHGAGICPRELARLIEAPIVKERAFQFAALKTPNNLLS